MNAIEQLKDNLLSGSYTTKLTSLYCCEADESGYYAQCFAELIDGFTQVYGEKMTPQLFTSPGRIEIAGNHTDKQNGSVLLACVNKDLIAAASKNKEHLIHLSWPDNAVPPIDLKDLEIHHEEYGKTESIIRGIAASLHKMGFKIDGANIYIASNIPKGFGLNSLSAFEMILIEIFDTLYCKNGLDAKQKAHIAQHVQTEYYGKPSSGMDQIVMSLGGVVGINFQELGNPISDKLEYDFRRSHHMICIVNSGVTHKELSLEYEAITREMHLVAEYFGREFLSQVEPATFLKELGALRKNGIADRALLRAIHFYKESERAQEEFSALADNDFSTFLQLVRASSLSSYMYLQNIFNTQTPQQQDIALTMALCQELLGDEGAYRVHGGGFAGTVEAFVPLILLEHFQLGCETLLGKGMCQVVTVRAEAAIELKP